MSGLVKRVKDLQMLVHLEGYDRSEDTWESWQALKDNIVAQEYCNNNADLHRSYESMSE
jgi:hypothetical protein